MLHLKSHLPLSFSFIYEPGMEACHWYLVMRLVTFFCLYIYLGGRHPLPRWPSRTIINFCSSLVQISFCIFIPTPLPIFQHSNSPWLYNIFLHVFPWVYWELFCTNSKVFIPWNPLIDLNPAYGLGCFDILQSLCPGLRCAQLPPHLPSFISGRLGPDLNASAPCTKWPPKWHQLTPQGVSRVLFFLHLTPTAVMSRHPLSYSQLWLLSHLSATNDVMHDAGRDPPRARVYQLGPTDWRFTPSLCFARKGPLC